MILYYYLVNFCMIFTLTVLIFWPHIHATKPEPLIHYPVLSKLLMGIKFGTVGLLSVWICIPYENGLLINSWVVPLLFCGLLGGPLAILFAGSLMVAGRIFLFEMYPISAYMMSNFILLIFILTIAVYFRPVHFRNIQHYFFFALVEISIALFISTFYIQTSYYSILHLAFFNVITFFAIKIVLVQSQYAIDKVKLSLSLDQKDYLTQLPNNYAIEAMLKYNTLHNLEYAFLFIDIDHFKHFNVDYGYLVGDSILKEIADMLEKFAKENDAQIGRLSGEEFCCILQNEPPAIAIYKAEKFRQSITNHTFGREHGLSLSVTISIGVTNVPDNAMTPEDIFKTANLAITRTEPPHYNYVQHINQTKKG